MSHEELNQLEWYLDADWLSEIDEEYRARNRTFRKAMLRLISAQPSHPLRFLVNRLKRWHRSGSTGTTWDAGHIIPVAQLKKRGTTLERLAVQDRHLNRSSGATRIPIVVMVKGVPVDLNTLKAWSRRHPALKRFTTSSYVRDNTVRGWSSVTGKILKELEDVPDWVFVIGNSGGVWARRTGT